MEFAITACSTCLSQADNSYKSFVGELYLIDFLAISLGAIAGANATLL